MLTKLNIHVSVFVMSHIYYIQWHNALLILRPEFGDKVEVWTVSSLNKK